MLLLLHMLFKFSAYNDIILLLCFRSYLFICFKSLSKSRIRCEWVLPLFPNSRLSLESVLGFCHGIAKGGDCKVVIYNYVFCWLLFRAKFDCNYYQSFIPCICCGNCCKGCVIESVWRLKQSGSWWNLAGMSRLSFPRSEACALHMLECEESGQVETAVSREYLAGKAFPRDTRETSCSASLYWLTHTFCTYPI